jgi:hypothetical protein
MRLPQSSRRILDEIARPENNDKGQTSTEHVWAFQSAGAMTGSGFSAVREMVLRSH